jgi:hypothetical protein
MMSPDKYRTRCSGVIPCLALFISLAAFVSLSALDLTNGVRGISWQLWWKRENVANAKRAGKGDQYLLGVGKADITG